VDAICESGIISGDDIWVADLRCRFDFSLKASNRRFVLRQPGRKHLDRHEPLHPAMFRLEDITHAPCSDLFEQDVIVQQQGLGFASINLFRLKLRESVLADEFTGQFFSIFGRCLRRNKVLDRVRSDKSALFKLLNELFECDCHVADGRDATAL